MFYILKNKKGEYWNNSGNWNKRWDTRPRLFRSPQSLLSSFRWNIPKAWIKKYVKENNLEASDLVHTYHYEYSLEKKWSEYIKNNKLSSIDILKMLISDGYTTYYMNEFNLKSIKKL